MTSLPFKAPRSRGWLYAVVALLFFTLMYIGLPALFQELEYRLYDYRLRFLSRPQALDDIVMIDIDDMSTEALGSWPWHRGVHAQVVDVLSQCNVGLVVFDVLFRGEGFGPEEGNVRFSRALAQNGKVILSAAVQLVKEEEPVRLELDDADRVLRGSFMDLKGLRVKDLFQTEASLAPLPLFSGSAAGVGHIAALCDSDGVFRRLPLIVGFNGNIFPSIDLLAMIKYLQPVKIGWVEGKGLRLEGVSRSDGGKGNFTIPMDDKGCMLINYAGRWGEAFDHISVHKIYESYGNPSKMEQFRDRLRNKVVIISLAISGSTDIGPIPIETATPLSTIHSNAINTILTGAFIKETSGAVQILLGLFIIAVIIIVSWRLSPLLFSIAFLALISAYTIANFILFSKFGVVMNLSGVTLAASTTFVVLLVHGYVTTARESALQKDVLKAYFSPKIIDQIMKSPDVFSLEGSGQELTVLFSDIAGFTNLSDNLHPAEVQHILSEYLEAMTDVIFKHNGAVDKFMGDGIMAFWGYPEAEDTGTGENLRMSASDAVRAAVEMQRKMRDLNHKWAREGRKTLHMRIGINTGYVTLGNMGSKHRLDFTLIGKNVNLAQRLEGAAPTGGILVSSRTHSLVTDEIKAEEVKDLSLSGFEEHVQAYLVEW